MTFLHQIAEDLLNRYGNDLSKVAVVFPNKRASLFLNDELARMADGPVWTPTYITISEFFRRYSEKDVADQILLISKLHEVYVNVTGNADFTLDRFFGWGQLLLADFDDLDKNMVSANQLFSLVSDIHELDNADFLTDVQREVLQHFFAAFNYDHTSYMRQQFLSLWSKLGEIYDTYRQSLAEMGLAYEGMLYREVVENASLADQLNYDAYCFAGFNMLQKVEQKLFTTIKKAGKALFYWDYDSSFLKPDHEAGHFINQYLSIFPSALKDNADKANVGSKHEQSITYVSSPTDNLQSRFVSKWLLENERYKAGARTAIVMCDENLLQSVVASLPEEVKNVNITTGFPLAQTNIVSMLSNLLELNNSGRFIGSEKFRQKYVLSVLNHPAALYISDNSLYLAHKISNEYKYFPLRDELSLDEGLKLLFADPYSLIPETATGGSVSNLALLNWLSLVIKRIAVNKRIHDKGNNISSFISVLENEAVFKISTIISRLYSLVEKGWLDVEVVTLQRLLLQIIRSASVPFHGEPAEGVQIMGVLETRCLDFDNILVLSCNEGCMPKREGDSSFIPHSVRSSFEMTTVEHKEGIYSYYFHRLLSRSKDITICYNSSADGLKTGEMSRFMLQLLVESPVSITKKALQTGQTSDVAVGEKTIVKTPLIMQAIEEYMSSHALSPSALSNYLRCKAKFFYQNIAHLRELDADNVDDMDLRVFGLVFHKAAEILYSEVKTSDGTVTKDVLDKVYADKRLQEDIVDRAFASEVFKVKEGSAFRPDYNGLHLINKTVIMRFFADMIKYDAEYAPFKIESLENEYYAELNVKLIDGNERSVRIGGKVDRLDSCVASDGSRRYRVVDYKTGREPSKVIPDIEGIFDPSKVKEFHADYYLQAFLYSYIIRQEVNVPVVPALMFMACVGQKDYDPVLCIGSEKVSDIKVYSEEYLKNLTAMISEILNPDVPFDSKYDEENCKFCPFTSFCKNAR